MAQHVAHFDTGAIHRAGIPTPGRQAYQLLRVGFGVLPVVAGLDKFTGLLARWEDYLSPRMIDRWSVAPHDVMRAVGVVEIGVGLLVLTKPKVGAWVLAAWLAAIIVNLLSLGSHYDVALRDVGLMLGAIALARLSVTYYARGTLG